MSSKITISKSKAKKKSKEKKISCKINKHKWNLIVTDKIVPDRDEFHGQTFHNEKKIELSSFDDEREHMDTIIHEVAHASTDPKLTESDVIKLADSATNALWELGYRKKRNVRK